MIKQSVCVPILKPESISNQEFFAQAAHLGFAAVEFWQFPEHIDEIWSLCQAHHLVIASFTGHESIAEGMNRRENHPRIKDELMRSLELAHQYHIPGIICFSGNRNPDQPRQEALDNCIRCLTDLTPHAEQLEINLNLELLNSLVDHPGYDCDHSDWGFEVVKSVNSSNVKVLFDIYHMQIMEGNIITNLVNNLQWVGHIHTAGVPGRFDFDDHQELNYKGICKALSDQGYDRYVGHEFRPRRNYLESLQVAFNTCDQ
ncbi:MAG: TIM barrel protein [Anaerolineae bacterium]|nr:TIM barrel protein [Anaerolineae bacterium]